MHELKQEADYHISISTPQLNSLGEGTLPECEPHDVNLFCWQVRTNNIAFRTGQKLGSVEGPTTLNHGWILSDLIDTNAVDNPEVLNYICNTALESGSCPEYL